MFNLIVSIWNIMGKPLDLDKMGQLSPRCTRLANLQSIENTEINFIKQPVRSVLPLESLVAH